MKIAIFLCVALGWALLHPPGAAGLTLETLALQNDPSPAGFPYRRFGNPVVGDTPGRVAVYGRTSPSTTTTSVAPPLISTTGIFLCDPATCPVAPATAAVTKGLLDDAGNAFSSFSTPGVSSAGDIAFSSRVGSPGFHGSGVYIRQFGGDIVTVALTGDPVPPPSPTAVFKRLTDPPAMSPSGKVAFRGRIKASASPRNRRGIFLAE